MVLILHLGLRTIALDPTSPYFSSLRISGFPGSPALLLNEFSGAFLCSRGSCGNGFLLFPGGVARFAFAVRDVKFSAPLINGPKPTALQPYLSLS